MGMMYSAVFSSVAVTAAQDFFEITAPSDAVVMLHSVELTQSTEVGDAQEEGVAILFKRGATSSGSGGSAPTPQPTQFGFAAAGSTVEVNNTTPASGGTITTLVSSNWNVRSPYLWLPTPECRIVLSPSQRLVVATPTTVADSITMSGTMFWEEIGG